MRQIILINFYLSFINLIEAGMYMKKLNKKLFEDYNPTLRPVSDDKSTLDVKFSLSIQQILEVNNQKQTLTISGWLNLEWFDDGLKWNPEDFGHINETRVPQQSIWIPDIFLFSAANSDSWNTFSTTGVLADVSSSGKVYINPPALIEASCNINIEDFPFDEQDCRLYFASWMYDISNINLTKSNDQAFTNTYIPNGEWDLESAVQNSGTIVYEGDPRMYSYVTVTLHLRRRTLFYVFNYVLPCFIISTLCLLGFLLPVDSGEKMSLEITILLAAIFFMQSVTTIVPASSLAIPKISLYFGSVSFLCMFSVVANVYVLSLHHKDVRLCKEMPKWFEILVCDCLASLMLMNKPKIHPTNINFNTNKTQITVKEKSLNVSPGYKEKPNLDLLKSNLMNNYTKQDDFVKELLLSISSDLEFFKRNIESKKKYEKLLLKWYFAAMVIDRFCFIVSLIYLTVTLIAFVLTMKNFYRFK